MIAIKRDTPVLVEWQDICDYSGDDWNGEYELEEMTTAHIVSVGWVATDYTGGPEFRLARDRSVEDGKYRSVVNIPADPNDRRCINSVRDMRTGLELWDVGEEDPQ